MASSSGWHRRTVTTASRARARKYASPEHRAARKTIQAQLDRGPVTCWRCGYAIPNDPKRWHVGHDDHDVNLIRGAEHAACNIRAAARKGARVANRRGRPRPLRRVSRKHLL